jgi:hypothetical protein
MQAPFCSSRPPECFKNVQKQQAPNVPTRILRDIEMGAFVACTALTENHSCQSCILISVWKFVQAREVGMR